MSETHSNAHAVADKPAKPSKPYPEFPLTAHPAGTWCKKIRGKLHYFGPWADPDSALQKQLDLIREPRLIPVSKPLLPGPYDDEVEVVLGYAGGARLACGAAHPCPMLGADNLCQVYPTRPNCCVAFQPGTDQCQHARERAGLPPLKPVRVPRRRKRRKSRRS